MKKVLTILLCAVLAISFVGIADAAGEQTITGVDYKQSTAVDPSNYPSKDVEVTLSIDEAFTVTIPSDFHLSNSGDGHYKHYATASVYITRIDPGSFLTLSIDGNQYSNETGWYLTGAGGVELLFGIKLGNNPNTGHIDSATDPQLLQEKSPIISTNEKGHEISTGMHFKLLDALPTQSGDYKSTITFTVEMSNGYKDYIYLN